MSSPESNGASLPDLPDESSRGSSVSSDFQREYEEILKFAVVTPKFQIAPNVYNQGTSKPTSSQVKTVNTTSRAISGAEAMHLSTIVENLSSEISVSDVEDGTVTASSSSASSMHQPGKSSVPVKDKMDESSQKRVTRFATSLPASSGNFPSRYNPDLSDGARALERLMSGIDPAKQGTIGFNSPAASETTSSSANQSPSSISLDGIDDPVDQDLVRMEHLMDEWCLDLKRNVMGEFSSSKLKLIEKLKQKIYIQKQKHATKMNASQNETEGLKELLHTFERSVHQKDVVIANLTDAVQRQKEKCDKLKVLLTWKLKCNDDRREQFASKLARRHYQRTLASKTWAGWRSIVESRWKQRVERACQARSQEVCVKLTEDYEERLLGLQKSLDAARGEVARLHSERDQYEETMKKAFMRGVCALNMEAMHMFKEGGGDEENCDPRSNDPVPHQMESQPSLNPSTRQQPMPAGILRTDKQQQSQCQPVSTAATRKSGVSTTAKLPTERKIHVKTVGKADFSGKRNQHGGGSAPPMVTSVFVERHKQGDERSYASARGASQLNKTQQPKSQTSRNGTTSAGINQKPNRLQTVKVVE